MKHIVRTTIAALAIGIAATAANAQMKEAKDVKIAVVVHGTSADLYWNIVKRGVEDAAALTGAQVQYVDMQVFDEVEHARRIDAAVATRPDGLIVSIADPDALRGAVTAAIAAGIPTMNIDSNEVPGEEMGVTFYVGTVSEYDSGKKAGDRLGKAGVLKVVCINHEVGNTSLDDRCRGLNDGLAPHGGGTEVVAVTKEVTDIQSRTAAYLSAHPDVQGVFAMGADAANPLIPLFKEKEWFGKIKLYTFDISPEVLDSIIAGEMEFGMDAQQYLMGFIPVINMVEHVTHGFWPQSDVYTGPLFVDTPEAAQAILALAKEGIR